MREILFKPEFSSWRAEARKALESDLPPSAVFWKSTRDMQEEFEGLFGTHDVETLSVAPRSQRHTVPAEFVRAAQVVSCHRDPSRWTLLYRLLWRLTRGEPELLSITVDPDVVRFESMRRSVQRDMHKMKAFVRFCETLDPETGSAHFVAWYRPDHQIVRMTGPFFAERFNGMNWSILTEDESAHWDGKNLTYGPGCPKSMAPTGDEVEGLWKTYYASIFNPARIKTRAMKKELPVRYWRNLPETELIPSLIQSAPSRLQDFYVNQPKRAQDWFPVPGKALDLDELRKAAGACRACALCENATQTVFGEGPRSAKIVVIGEQPGDQEDLIGRPFQGPAGRLLDRALKDAGLDRSTLYLTNAVKHFKWKPQGKVRLHQKPASSEIGACKPWLAAEIELLKPEVIICLGVTAAQSVFGKVVTLKELRGKVHSTGWCEKTWVTTHPSAVLRMEGDEAQATEYQRLVEDLKAVHLLVQNTVGRE